MKKNAVLLAVLWPLSAFASAPQEVAGIYPSLAMFNAEGECGTGAVVPWAGSLWAITYAPHAPYGSSDKLYEITPNLRQIIRPESVGGTPACRMIHEETNQLLIGPYLIDESKNVRVIPPFTMPGRLTGIARHLAAPGNKAYYATMEEGLYELDLQSLEVKCVIREGGFFQIPEGAKTYPEALVSALPGYHGKGLYSGQGRLVYANNGERSKAAEADPKTPSGALAEWRGSGDWELVRRNQFTEVTGPGGTYELDANLNLVRKEDPELEKELAGVMEIPQGILQNDNASAIYKDPQGRTWRLPRLDGSFADAVDARMAREVCTERDLFNCGGTFYELPAENAGGIAKVRPVATHGLRIQDYCSYRGLLVMTGIDGSEKNPRIVRSSDAQAAVWLGVADDLWKLGKPRGKGGPWMRSQVRAGIPSDPFLMTGFDQKRLDLSNEGDTEADFTLEADVTGDGSWAVVKRFRVKPGETIQHTFPAWFQACWARLIPSQDAVATAQFTYE
jgi:hypothetical protein